MKPLHYLSVIALLLMSSCFSPNYLVDYDYSYKSSFKRYKSFGFMEHSNADALTTSNSDIIQSAITRRLGFLGYESKERRPDLLLMYKFFSDSFDFKGFEQPFVKSWLRVQDTTAEYKARDYTMRNGTLLVHIIDRKRNSTVWQGYASGLNVYPNPSDNERIIKNAIISIFDRFELFSQAAMSKN